MFVFFRLCRFICAKYVSERVCSWFEAGIGCRMDSYGSHDSWNIPNCNQVADWHHQSNRLHLVFNPLYTCNRKLWGPPGGGGSVLPWSLKIMHWSPRLPANNVLDSLKVFAFAPQIPKNSSASPQIPKNISQFSLKCIYLSVELKSHTWKLLSYIRAHDLMIT